MNKRARTRLIGVTAIILIAVAAIFLAGGNKTAAYYKTVAEAAEDSKLVGERVKVGGAVVNGSWDKKSNPMTFTIRDEGDEEGSGPTVKVVYNGAVPSTFGDGVVAIVTGDLSKDQVIEADEMITKCPSKYESAEGAMPVSDVKDGMTMEKVTVAGVVKNGSVVPPGGDVRFVVAEAADGSGEHINVKWEGALPDGLADGSDVVLTGKLNGDRTFEASDVALAK